MRIRHTHFSTHCFYVLVLLLGYDVETFPLHVSVPHNCLAKPVGACTSNANLRETLENVCMVIHPQAAIENIR